jgi:hypothetical protein
LDARALGGSRQGEIQGFVDHHGVGLADRIANLPSEDIRLQQECGGVGPVANRGADGAAATREIVGFDLGKGARAGDTR